MIDWISSDTKAVLVKLAQMRGIVDTPKFFFFFEFSIRTFAVYFVFPVLSTHTVYWEKLVFGFKIFGN